MYTALRGCSLNMHHRALCSLDHPETPQFIVFDTLALASSSRMCFGLLSRFEVWSSLPSSLSFELSSYHRSCQHMSMQHHSASSEGRVWQSKVMVAIEDGVAHLATTRLAGMGLLLSICLTLWLRRLSTFVGSRHDEGRGWSRST